MTVKLGLTGSIGMGKSTVAAMFADAGVPVFDADAEVRRLQAPGGRLLPLIAARFPGTVKDGVLDREALARQAFADPAALRALEAMILPALKDAREAFLARHLGAPLLLFDIPLLFEKRMEDQFDKIIVVSAPPEVQRARVLARPLMTPERFEQVRASQWDNDIKRGLADFVIDTGTDLASTRAQVERILACLAPRAGG